MARCRADARHPRRSPCARSPDGLPASSDNGSDMTTTLPTVTVPLDLLRVLLAVATTDEKTGALTYRAWREQAARRAADYSLRTGAVLMVDVDRFAAVNARHGYLGADAVLWRIAQAVTTALGSDSVVGRFGGDEFVAFRPVDGLVDARRVADDARQAVADLRTRAEGPDGPRTITGVTVSVGVGVGSPVDLTRLWWAADRALYVAKRAGRNTVHVIDTAG